MRALAIDLGKKSVGIAISDALGITGRPVEVFRRSNDDGLIERIKTLVDDLEVETVVVGLPLKMDGTRGDAASATLRFVDLLSSKVPVKVATQDERLTSYEAEQRMMELGFNREQRKGRSDEFAATIILQDYLSHIESKTEEKEALSGEE